MKQPKRTHPHDDTHLYYIITRYVMAATALAFALVATLMFFLNLFLPAMPDDVVWNLMLVLVALLSFRQSSTMLGEAREIREAQRAGRPNPYRREEHQ